MTRSSSFTLAPRNAALSFHDPARPEAKPQPLTAGLKWDVEGIADALEPSQAKQRTA